MLYSEIKESFPNRAAKHSNTNGVLLSRVAIYGDESCLKSLKNKIESGLDTYTEMVYGNPEFIKEDGHNKAHLEYVTAAENLKSHYDFKTSEFYVKDISIGETYII